MTRILASYAVHGLTATGAIWAMLALVAAAQAQWGAMFGWLLLALAVDAIDGPLARRLSVRTNAPAVDGTVLDLVVDYLTYVFVPAYALHASGAIPGAWGLAMLAVILGPSAAYFAGRWMKTTDGAFLGFPACWNMVALVIFTLAPPAWASISAILVLAVAMFLPLRFIHPVRVARWRFANLAAIASWGVLAGWAAIGDFALPPAGQWALAAATAYLLGAGLAQQAMRARG